MTADVNTLQDDEKVTIAADSCCLIVPHIGLTLRVLLAVAAEGYKLNPRRTWKIVYKDTVIGSVRIKDKIIKTL